MSIDPYVLVPLAITNECNPRRAETLVERRQSASDIVTLDAGAAGNSQARSLPFQNSTCCRCERARSRDVSAVEPEWSDAVANSDAMTKVEQCSD
jgi:hypothetical protein